MEPQSERDQDKAIGKPTRMRGCLTNALYYLLIIFIIVILAGVYHGRGTAKLACERAQRDSQVDCTVHRYWMLLIPLGSKEIQDVRGASLIEDLDSEGNLRSYVELNTNQGGIPLLLGHLGSLKDMEVVSQINQFMRNGSLMRLNIEVDQYWMVWYVGSAVVGSILDGVILYWLDFHASRPKV